MVQKTLNKTDKVLITKFSSLTNAIINSIPFGIIAFNRKGDVILNNQKHCLIESINTMSTSSYNILNDPVIKEQGFEGQLKDVLKGKSFEMIVPKFHNIEGAVFSIHLTGLPLIDSTGRIDGGILIIDDIAWALKKEDMLRKQKTYYESIFNNHPVATITVNIEKKIVTANKAFLRFVDFTLSDIIGKDFASLIVPDKEPEFFEVIDQDKMSNKNRTATAKLKGKNGTIINVKVKSYPITIDNKVNGSFIVYTFQNLEIDAEDNQEITNHE